MFQVLERLRDLYGDLYTEQNVMLSGTHTHSGPGGHFTYWMYQFISGGWVNDTYHAYVDGIVQVSQEQKLRKLDSALRMGGPI